ncbi:MAG: ABC transporter ATP-binding protein [Cyanobacteria bacterium J06614_10]
MSRQDAGALRFEKVSYTYANAKTAAIAQVSFTANPGDLVVVVGPSGCGKSTLLKTVSGLIEPNHGSILIDGKDVVGKPPQRRNIGWVPQSYALFDHLSVTQNITFGLRMQGMSTVQQKRRAQEMLSLCQIAELAERSVRSLSGGQRQRVAIARALAVQPRVLLLDEPLAALDPQLRAALRTELVKMVRKSGATTLFVTHDQAEALAIADHIAVLRDGCLEQYGTPEDLWHYPQNAFVAEFLSNAKVVECRLKGVGEQGYEVEIVPGLTANIRPDKLSSALADYSVSNIALHPEDIEIDADSRVRAVADSCEYAGGQYLIGAQILDGPTLSFFSPRAVDAGTAVPIRVSGSANLSIVTT